MERRYSPDVTHPPEVYRESLEKARKEFPAIIRRLSPWISPEETETLIEAHGTELNPQFEYPNLFDLDEQTLAKKINTIEGNLTTVLQIERGGYHPTIDDEFDKDKAVTGLANAALLAATQTMQLEGYDQPEIANRFMILNEQLNGPVDTRLYQGVVNGLHDIIGQVKPEQSNLYKIAQELLQRIPERAGDERIAALPDEVFKAYADAYHIIYDRWLDEIIPPRDGLYDSKDISEVFEKAMSSAGFEANVEVSEDVLSIKYRKEERKFFTPASRTFTRDQLAAKVVHEIGHLTRGWNGSYFSMAAENGLPEYLDAEDGLMSYGEQFITGNQRSNPTYLERYFGIGYMTGAVDGTMKDFKDTFSAMWRARVLFENQDLIAEGDDTDSDQITAARKESLMNALRLFRGGDGKTPGLGWTKDKVYYEGVAKLVDFLTDFPKRFGLEYLPILFAAKYDPTNNLHNKYLGTPIKPQKP